MPRIKAALRESTPVEHLPAKRESLKRTNSTASLPTPPRTRKRKRSHSRHSRATDSDSEFDFQDSDDEELERGRVELGKNAVAAEHNKRKLLRLDAIAAELSGKDAEDAFWMGESTVTEIETARLKRKADTGSKEKATETNIQDSPARHTRSQTRSPSSSPAQLLKRTRTGLLSPPKSHRRKSPRKPKLGALPIIAEEAPSTPPPKTILDGVKKKLFPERDSPNNPFLVSDDSPAGSQESQSSGAGASTARVPQTPKKHVERPTLTYVLYVFILLHEVTPFLNNCATAEVCVKSLKTRFTTPAFLKLVLHQAAGQTRPRICHLSIQIFRQRNTALHVCFSPRLASDGNAMHPRPMMTTSLCYRKRLQRAKARPKRQ